jgi:heme-degrading monooxygenase HmoA
MFIAMNRFKVKSGSEEEFEEIWKGRDSKLSDMKGFREFQLLRGPVNEDEGYTLFASHTVWETKDDFVAWTNSQSFRDSHKNAGGGRKVSYMGHPQFEGFSVVEGA